MAAHPDRPSLHLRDSKLTQALLTTYLPLTTYHLPLTTYHLLPTAHFLTTAYCPLPDY
jgi:hypothetical protein